MVGLSHSFIRLTETPLMNHSFNCSLTVLTTVALLFVPGCGVQELPRQDLTGTTGEVQIHGDVWADNWFALYLGDDLLIEDSVSITTERSFNAESFAFKADYPVVLNFVVKDFKENDTGLEYIGSSRQQMGDGGFIAQLRDATSGKLLTATNAKWKCMVLHHGPVDEDCVSEESPVVGKGPCDCVTTEEPADWKLPAFSTDAWKSAKEFTESDVRPKQGYDQIEWDSAARLIWSDDLKKDNTLLFRVVINKPE